MPVFACRVADGKGKIEEFLRESVSEESLLRELGTGGSFVLSVREVGEGSARRRGWRRFPRKLVLEFTSLLSLMLGSGLSLKDSLEVAQTVFARGAGNELAALLLEKIRKGSTFHAALESVGGSFPPVYRGLVSVGERIGTLDAVLQQLAAHLEDDRKLRERFGTAIVYPAIVLGVAILAMVLMAVLVIPRMQALFSQFGGDAAARMDSLTAALGASLAAAVGVVIVGVAAVAYVIAQRRKGGRASQAADAVLLRTPLLKTYILNREMLMLCFAMETLTGAGMAVDEALREAAGATGNSALRAGVLEIRQGVVRGERLSAAFSRSTLFPARMAQWIGIGEKIGHVEKVFRQLRLYYQQEVDKWTQRMTAFIEPALIVFLGTLILLFVILFVVPLFNLYGGVL